MQDWTYQTEFNYSNNVKNENDIIVLKLEKIGTFAKVYLNNVKIETIDNLFRTYYINLKGDLLRVNRKNTLKIELESTVRKTYELRANFDE
jgi:beta-galactosidase/beta-glucuronidase